MASGHVYRAKRPNTWLLRPMLQREENPCQPGAVHTWPMADLRPQSRDVCFPEMSDQGEPACQGQRVARSRPRPKNLPFGSATESRRARCEGRHRVAGVDEWARPGRVLRCDARRHHAACASHREPYQELAVGRLQFLVPVIGARSQPRIPRARLRGDGTNAISMTSPCRLLSVAATSQALARLARSRIASSVAGDQPPPVLT